MVYDPALLSYAQLLGHLADWHTPRRTLGQYRSIVFVPDGQDAAVAGYLAGLGEVRPECIPEGADAARFWDAEAYHQKYRLRRDQDRVARLRERFGARWDESELATKWNAKGVLGFDLAAWQL